MKRSIRGLLPLLIIFLFFMGYRYMKSGQNENATDYKQVTGEEALKMMSESKDYIILDVRTKAEYAEGHIKGAINIPNETIGNEDIAELPNKEQLIFVYCRSGNRSKQAAAKLATNGYTGIVDMGGINTWQGEIEK